MKPDLPERGQMLPGDKMVLHFKVHLMLLVALDTNINAGQTERQQSGKQSGKPSPLRLVRRISFCPLEPTLGPPAVPKTETSVLFWATAEN